jgi:hypothetical protein
MDELIKRAKEDTSNLSTAEGIYLGLGMLMGYPGPMDRCVSTWIVDNCFGASCSIKLSEEDACFMEDLGWRRDGDYGYEIAV